MKYLLFIQFLFTACVFGAWHDVTLCWSDGKIEECAIAKMGGEQLIINCHPEKRMPDDKIHLDEIVAIRMTVRSSSMNQPWMWKESGKTDKVYFGDKYPFIDLGTELTLVDGRILKGNIISCAFRCKGGSKSKIFLSKQYKGVPGEKIEDALYPTAITFKNRTTRELKTLSGMVTDHGILQQVTACDKMRRQVFTAEISGNAFTFNSLPDGQYDLFVRTDKVLLCGFLSSDAVPDGLRQNERSADDFFKDRRILAFDNGNILIYKRRSEFYDSDEILKGGFMWHLEIWYWHTDGNGEWKLDARNIVVRHKQQGNESVRILKYMSDLHNCRPGATIAITKETPHDAELRLD